MAKQFKKKRYASAEAWERACAREALSWVVIRQCQHCGRPGNDRYCCPHCGSGHPDGFPSWMTDEEKAADTDYWNSEK